MLILPNDLHQKIMAHGESAYPFEGCGLLLGRVEGDHNVVEDVRPLANVWPNEQEKPVRFAIDPAAWQAVELEAMMADLDVIGIFHSHPDHPPVASPRDLAWASWPGYSYLITKIEDGTARTSQSWQLAPDRRSFVEETIQTKEERYGNYSNPNPPPAVRRRADDDPGIRGVGGGGAKRPHHPLPGAAESPV